MKTHYQTLGIPNCSSLVDIKKAYKSMALKHHPDRGGEIRRMQEINASYEYLVKNKEAYDQTIRPSRPTIKTYGFTIVVGGFNQGPINMDGWMSEATQFTNHSTTGGFSNAY